MAGGGEKTAHSRTRTLRKVYIKYSVCVLPRVRKRAHTHTYTHICTLRCVCVCTWPDLRLFPSVSVGGGCRRRTRRLRERCQTTATVEPCLSAASPRRIPLPSTRRHRSTTVVKYDCRAVLYQAACTPRRYVRAMLPRERRRSKVVTDGSCGGGWDDGGWRGL